MADTPVGVVLALAVVTTVPIEPVAETPVGVVLALPRASSAPSVPVAETPVAVVLALPEVATVPTVPVADTPVGVVLALPEVATVPIAPVADTPVALTETDTDPLAITSRPENGTTEKPEKPNRAVLSILPTVSVVSPIEPVADTPVTLTDTDVPAWMSADAGRSGWYNQLIYLSDFTDGPRDRPVSACKLVHGDVPPQHEDKRRGDERA